MENIRFWQFFDGSFIKIELQDGQTKTLTSSKQVEDEFSIIEVTYVRDKNEVICNYVCNTFKNGELIIDSAFSKLTNAKHVFCNVELAIFENILL